MQAQTQPQAPVAQGPKKIEPPKIRAIHTETNHTIFEAIVGNEVWRTRAFPGLLTTENAKKSYNNPHENHIYRLMDEKDLAASIASEKAPVKENKPRQDRPHKKGKR